MSSRTINLYDVSLSDAARDQLDKALGDTRPPPARRERWREKVHDVLAFLQEIEYPPGARAR